MLQIISIDLSSLFKHNIGRYKLANKLYLMLFKKIKTKSYLFCSNLFVFRRHDSCGKKFKNKNN